MAMFGYTSRINNTYTKRKSSCSRHDLIFLCGEGTGAVSHHAVVTIVFKDV